MSVTVVAAPEAAAQIQAIDAWWREHRKAAPGLFGQELAQAVGTLELMPLAGRRFAHPAVRELRRFLLRATHYHVYYTATADSVLVVAVWSQVRGTGPDLTGF